LPLWFDPTDTRGSLAAGPTPGTFRVIGSQGLGAYSTTAKSWTGSNAAGTNAPKDAQFYVFTTKGYLTSLHADDVETGGLPATNRGYLDPSKHRPSTIYQKPLTSNDNSHLHWHLGSAGAGGVASNANKLDNPILTDPYDDDAVSQEFYRLDCESSGFAKYSGFTHAGGTDYLSNGTGFTKNGEEYVCLQKGDMVFFFDVSTEGLALSQGNSLDPDRNWPLFHNIYTIEKIFYDRDEDKADGTDENDSFKWTLQGSIVLDKEPNFFFNGADGANIHVLSYKFQFPYQQSGYEYVSECSGRGVCNADAGLCECFTGHTGDDCSIQNTLAK